MNCRPRKPLSKVLNRDRTHRLACIIVSFLLMVLRYIVFPARLSTIGLDLSRSSTHVGRLNRVARRWISSPFTATVGAVCDPTFITVMEFGKPRRADLQVCSREVRDLGTSRRMSGRSPDVADDGRDGRADRVLEAGPAPISGSAGLRCLPRPGRH